MINISVKVQNYKHHVLEQELHFLIDSINEANFMEWISKAKQLVSKVKNLPEAQAFLDSLYQKLKSSSRITKQLILKHLIPLMVAATIITPTLINSAASRSGDAQLQQMTAQILAPPTKEIKQNGPDWAQYAKDADAYLKFFPGTPMNGALLAKCAKRTFDHTGTLVPIDFVLAQGQAESSLGTDPHHRNPKTNPFSVGEDDDRTTQHFKGIEGGVQAYYNLVARKYLNGKTVDQLLANYVDTTGQRYATDKKYEQKMSKRVNHVRDYLRRFHASQSSQNDVASL
jgi:hypothetical protein